MKIDIFSHILPKRYLMALTKKAIVSSEFKEKKNRANTEIDIRLRLMDRYPDVIQVLTVSLPPLETLVSPSDAAGLAKIANDELAELVTNCP